MDSTELAEMALSQAVDEHIDKSQEIVDRISLLEKEILHWNLEDIKKLMNYIQEIRLLLQKYFQIQIENFIKLKSIPSMRIADEIKSTYRIIAVDKKGMALFGPEMNKIAHITKITEHYKKKISSISSPDKN